MGDDTLQGDGHNSSTALSKSHRANLQVRTGNFDQGVPEAEVATNKPRTFADACAHPSAKVLVLRGRTSPVKAVEADGMLFIKNDEAEAAAEAIRSKAMDPASAAAVASEVAPAPKPTAGSAAALNSNEPSRSLVRSSATGYPISYAAAASKPPVGPKPPAAAFLHSAASSKFPAAPKYSAPASRPAVVLAPPLKEVEDDFAVAQRTPLPKYIAGIEGDKEGEFYAHSDTFGFTSLIPKSFQNTSFEAAEAAKELTNRAAKIKSEETANGMAKKAAVSKQARIKEAKTYTKQTNCQKPAEHKQKTEQTMVSVPAKENAPVTAYIVRPALR